KQSPIDLIDYVGAGAVFSTTTKEDAKNAVGLEWIQTLRNKYPALPIVGIGGINSDNAQAVLEAGADGVSVISAITQAKSIKKVGAELKIREMKEDILEMNYITKVRNTSAVIYNIMNIVAANFSANGLIAIGASPSISNNPKEAAEMAAKADALVLDRKSTRLNSSHVSISYAVFCLKKKKY